MTILQEYADKLYDEWYNNFDHSYWECEADKFAEFGQWVEEYPDYEIGERFAVADMEDEDIELLGCKVKEFISSGIEKYMA